MGASKKRFFTPSPEGRMAVLLKQSGLPGWCLLRLSVELERQTPPGVDSPLLRLAKTVVQLVETEHDLPVFSTILQDMRNSGDASNLDDVVTALNKAADELPIVNTLIHETAERCADFLKLLLLCLRDSSMAVPDALQLPLSNDSQLIEVAGYVGVAERASERVRSSEKSNHDKKAVYDKTLLEARTAAFNKAKTSSLSFISYSKDKAHEVLFSNRRAFTTQRELKKINYSMQNKLEFLQVGYADEVSIPFPDGSVRPVTPLIYKLPDGSTISMTLLERVVSTFRRSGAIGGASLIAAGVTTGIVLGSGGTALLPTLLAGAAPTLGGTLWGNSYFVGREADRLRWEQRCSKAIMEHQPELTSQFMSAWIESYDTYSSEIAKFFDFDKRLELLREIITVAGVKSRPA